RVQVYKGRVLATARFAMQEKIEVNAGEAVEATPVGRWKTVPFRKHAYLSKLPQVLPGIHMGFEKESPLAMDGLMPGVESIRFEPLGDSKPILVPGVSGSALSIRREGEGLVSDWQGISGDEPRTVMCWLRLDPEPAE